MEPQAIAAFVVAYLLGSLDFGVIVSKLAGVDIYSEGSGNPGTANVFRTMGKGAAAATMAGDIAKGVGAAALGDLWAGEPAGFAAGLAAVVGHCFPVWHGFKGGKGVATGLGAILWLEPLLGLGLGVGWGAIVATTRLASVGSMALVVVVVPGLALTGHRGWSLVWAALMATVIAWRHLPNIHRLVGGQESPVA
ncbi:MAG: glycerol-3-phosphate acyltransferase [Acidimicrobiia bacterium]|nr:glycerol-3-phosphate acyltransferase [Acidimicrobiia bacterium]